MTLIGSAHGINAWLIWMREEYPVESQRAANWKSTDPQTWPWPERLWRTWTLLHQANDTMPPKDVVPFPPPSAPSLPPPVTKAFWDGNGWMAVRFENLPSPTELVANGVDWIAAIVNHGAHPDGSHAMDSDDHANHQWLAQKRDAPYQTAGIKVGGWQWNQSFFPEIEAWMAAETTKAYGLDFFIANGENDWKGNDLPDRWCRAMVSELAARGLSSLPVAWSVLGAASNGFVFPFHYTAFTSRGWHILPQAYPQEGVEYTLHAHLGNQGVIAHGDRAGILRKNLHPTIANYGARADKAGAFKPTIDQWIADINTAKAMGIQGISLWAHDWSPAEYTKLFQAIK